MNAPHPDEFQRGIQLFNERDYFECHEVLEEVWRHQQDPERELTQGIIQIAVALYHASRDNFVGARKLMQRGIPRVERSLTVLAGIDVAALLNEAQAALQAIEADKLPQPFTIRTTK